MARKISNPSWVIPQPHLEGVPNHRILRGQKHEPMVPYHLLQPQSLTACPRKTICRIRLNFQGQTALQLPFIMHKWLFGRGPTTLSLGDKNQAWFLTTHKSLRWSYKCVLNLPGSRSPTSPGFVLAGGFADDFDGGGCLFAGNDLKTFLWVRIFSRYFSPKNGTGKWTNSWTPKKGTILEGKWIIFQSHQFSGDMYPPIDTPNDAIYSLVFQVCRVILDKKNPVKL